MIKSYKVLKLCDLKVRRMKIKIKVKEKVERKNSWKTLSVESRIYQNVLLFHLIKVSSRVVITDTQIQKLFRCLHFLSRKMTSNETQVLPHA
jgi:hypothetical protein